MKGVIADGMAAPTDLAVFGDSSGRQVKVPVGSAYVQGFYYNNSAQVTLAIGANGSGNPRIDTVVLNCDEVGGAITLLVVAGTPAGSPVAPALTQVAGTTWQVALADVAVANGAATITAGNVTDRRTQATPGLAKPLIASSVLGGTGTITFSSIPATFNHLRLVGVVRGSVASLQTLTVTFNGDAGANYDYGDMTNAGASPTGSATIGASSIVLGSLPGTSSAAGLALSFTVDIPCYAQTTFHKMLQMAGTTLDVAAHSLTTGFGRWHNTAAINSILLSSTSGSFIAGSAAYLYGIT